MKHAKKSRYTLVKGSFFIRYPDLPRQGPQPDGDTITFHPDNPALVRALPWLSGRGPKFNARNNIPVRYEGIDALETHFQGTHQNLQYANEARAENLKQLGFKDVVYFSDLPNNVQSASADSLPGYVLANGIESNGRLLGLVYTGTTTDPDGQKIFVDAAQIDQSVNVQLVKAGLAYVEPYDTMPMDLVQHLRQIIADARHAGAGMFAHENVGKGKSASIANLTAAEGLVMWPKLFRRLAAYFSEGHTGLGEFDAWIRQDGVDRDDTLRLPNGEKANMHDSYGINGNNLSLMFNPEDLLIAPDPAPATPQ